MSLMQDVEQPVTQRTTGRRRAHNLAMSTEPSRTFSIRGHALRSLAGVFVGRILDLKYGGPSLLPSSAPDITEESIGQCTTMISSLYFANRCRDAENAVRCDPSRRTTLLRRLPLSQLEHWSFALADEVSVLFKFATDQTSYFHNSIIAGSPHADSLLWATAKRTTTRWYTCTQIDQYTVATTSGHSCFMGGLSVSLEHATRSAQ
ncbi:uncharacterized protein B0H18DRAFT_985394 [Fomitopsis serialis]|uniref:uncharacterized protein n=1 Tax=Fomitopsis serialis TaxID=139415 RepID=UPI002007AB82|nr:uncharacterized protein B0H18DRAFT_985394 [Neoantrodia serialis]KAH9933065.1 hypothetical protein B0H18DRAFT_985394 [Neoantrodia serialis]